MRKQEGNLTKKKKGVILVSGSSGRIGTSLIKQLGNDYHIVGFELMKALYASANEELVPVDVSSPESVTQAFRHIEDFYGHKILSVVHLAAYYSFEDQGYQKYKKITVEGTKNILLALQNFEVEQFIFSSTMLVHKPMDPEHAITENSPIEGRWAYPMSKIETEEVIHKYRGKIPSVILRISGVYDDLCHSIPIANQIQRIYEKQMAGHFFPGDTSHGASFMHMDDLIEALLLCIKKRKELAQETILLIGDDQTLSTDEMQRKISESLFGKSMRTYRIPKALAWLGVTLQNMLFAKQKSFIKPWMVRLADDDYHLNVTLAKQVLGWQPKHHLSKDLDVILENMKKDPEAWYKINGLKPSLHIRHLWKKEGKKQNKKRS